MSKKKTKKTPIDQAGEEPVVIKPGAESPEEPEPKLPLPDIAAVLPIRNMVLFPGTIVPLAVAREKSRLLLDDVLPEEKIVVCVCQKDPHVDDPQIEDLHSVGTAVVVLKLLQGDEDQQSIVVHGVARVKIDQWVDSEPYFRAKVSFVEETEQKETTETEALMVNARNLAGQVIELSPNIPNEAAGVLSTIETPGAMSDFLASNLQVETGAKQKLLEEPDPNERLRKVSVELQKQIEVLELSNKIQDQVKENIDQTQRKYYLQEQLKAIQKELGEVDEKTAELEQLEKSIREAKMPESVETEALRELSRLERISVASPEYNVIRTYLDVMAELPWSEQSDDNLDVKRARKILNEDHYGLDKVKRRILEYLAVRKLAPESRGPILCFVGPPGVGKTSLGQSIARSLNREFIRMSLGGVRDEAELRGHRRTYIGALPGRFIQELRKAGKNNPVYMLDELDKVGSDFRGDPTSVLLEVLDPAQNDTFQDNYLNVPFDLSNVLFIATANVMSTVPRPLRDRMEVIEIPGYTQQEKLQIAMRYLVPRQLKENGLSEKQAKWTEKAVDVIIGQYTREAGVRELERQIGSVCRGLAAMIASGEARSRKITPKFVREMLGARQYEDELAMRTSVPGVATGLAYTPTGGTILFIEAASYPGKGALRLTGQIGDVMKESVQAALSLVKSNADKLEVDPEELDKTDLHIHVPAGAVPKDGPSAGVAMFTALTSILTGKTVRPELAMTGEITLRGLVLPVGGIKEKVLAARRAGITEVILPSRNEKNLEDVPEEARNELTFHFVDKVDDVLGIALNSAQKKRRKHKQRSTKK
ncbi:MAG: endopeptidase La [Phycisphaerae bacterium]